MGKASRKMIAQGYKSPGPDDSMNEYLVLLLPKELTETETLQRDFPSVQAGLHTGEDLACKLQMGM